MRMRNKKSTKQVNRSSFWLDGGWVMMMMVGSEREREAVREREAMSEKIIKNVKE